MPFNDGKGGQPVAIEGASRNGHEQQLSQGFPRWPLDRLVKKAAMRN